MKFELPPSLAGAFQASVGKRSESTSEHVKDVRFICLAIPLSLGKWQEESALVECLCGISGRCTSMEQANGTSMLTHSPLSLFNPLPRGSPRIVKQKGFARKISSGTNDAN